MNKKQRIKILEEKLEKLEKFVTCTEREYLQFISALLDKLDSFNPQQ